MLSIVILVHLSSLEIVFNLGLGVQGSFPESLLVRFRTQRHNEDIPGLKVCILQCQNSLLIKKNVKLSIKTLIIYACDKQTEQNSAVLNSFA